MRVMRWWPVRSTLLALLVVMAVHGQAGANARVLDGFDDPARWRLQVSEGAQARLSRVGGGDGGRALCVQADFGALPGSVRLSAPLPLQLPADSVLVLSSRGQAPQAQLSLQLVDAGGRRHGSHHGGRALGNRWQPLDWRVSDFTDAAGQGLALPAAASSIEWRLASASGGKAQWCLDSLAIEQRPADTTPFEPVALADTATALQQRMVDGRSDTLWVSSGVKRQTVSLDLGREREVGGLLVQWGAGLRADRYRVQASRDGRRWQVLRTVNGASGNTDRLRLGPLQARYLRLDLEDGPNWRYGIVDLLPQPAAFGRSTEAFLAEVGKSWPASVLPASLHGGPLGWTVLGAPGALAPVWFSEQGVVEPQPGVFTLEPQLQVDGQWYGASDAEVSARHQPGAAHSRWQHGMAQLDVLASTGQDRAGQPWLRLRYRLSNPDGQAHRYALALAVRPFQLHAAGRLGDLPGGVGGIHQLALEPGRARVNGNTVLLPVTPAAQVFASQFDAGLDLNLLRAARLPTTSQAEDPEGLASGAMLWRRELAAGDSHEWEVWLPLSTAAAATAALPEGFQSAVLAGEGWVLPGEQGGALVSAWQAAVARILAEQVGPWLRRDSRMAIGGGNRDAMAMVDALLLADQGEAVVPWLLARIASGSTADCRLLQHWAGVAAGLHAAGGWGEQRLQALQPWLTTARPRFAAAGSCAGSAPAALAASQLDSLVLPLMPPVEGEATTADQPPPSPAVVAGGALKAPGEAVSLAQRQQIWEDALAQLDDQLLPGWQRWVRGQSRGLLDARQAAGQVRAIAAVVASEQHDHLQLLPGLPAQAWRDGRLQVPGLLTRWGRLGLQGRREGNDWVLQFAPGLQLPPAGLVLDWPFAAPPAPALVDGQLLPWQDGRLHLRQLPAELRISLPSP